MCPIRPDPIGSGQIDGNPAGSDRIEIGAGLQSLLPTTSLRFCRYTSSFKRPKMEEIPELTWTKTGDNLTLAG
ncbi:hypothetical protein AVEN_211113-1, partial [Araneus ventricosus]